MLMGPGNECMHVCAGAFARDKFSACLWVWPEFVLFDLGRWGRVGKGMLRENKPQGTGFHRGQRPETFMRLKDRVGWGFAAY